MHSDRLSQIPQDDDDCRFTEVCSRCASSCDSDLEAETSIDSPRSIPICMRAPTGAEAPRSGGSLHGTGLVEVVK